ncbi:MAG: V-type ATP synthase subunit E [Firmicutes bacterium]|nr:V-type ATP synthase subunit E [Bacillota bacterium]
MDNFAEKLNNFSSLVIEDANEKKDEKMAQLDRKYKYLMDAKENEYLQEAYEKIQNSVNESRKEANEHLLHVEMESKRNILLKREAIIDDVADAVVQRLREFKKKAEYKEWLLNKIKTAYFELGDGAKTVYIAGEDMMYKDNITEIPDTSNVRVEGAAERDFLGGVKVVNTDKRVSVDYSFKDMISEEKKVFLQNSGLALS